MTKISKPQKYDWIKTEKKYKKLISTKKFKKLSPAQQKKKALYILNNPIKLRK